MKIWCERPPPLTTFLCSILPLAQINMQFPAPYTLGIHNAISHMLDNAHKTPLQRPFTHLVFRVDVCAIREKPLHLLHARTRCCLQERLVPRHLGGLRARGRQRQAGTPMAPRAERSSRRETLHSAPSQHKVPLSLSCTKQTIQPRQNLPYPRRGSDMPALRL